MICRIDQEKLLKNGLDHAHITDAEKIYMKELQQCKEGESLLRNLFKASLAQFDARLTKTEFIVAARQFLWLPALKNPSCGLQENVGVKLSYASEMSSWIERKPCVDLSSWRESTEGHDI